MMQLELRCGCVIAYIEGALIECPTHGSVGVARTVGMRPPAFRGAVSGPHATTVDLGEFTGRIIGSGEKADA